MSVTVLPGSKPVTVVKKSEGEMSSGTTSEESDQLIVRPLLVVFSLFLQKFE